MTIRYILRLVHRSRSAVPVRSSLLFDRGLKPSQIHIHPVPSNDYARPFSLSPQQWIYQLRDHPLQKQPAQSLDCKPVASIATANVLSHHQGANFCSAALHHASPPLPSYLHDHPLWQHELPHTPLPDTSSVVAHVTNRLNQHQHPICSSEEFQNGSHIFMYQRSSRHQHPQQTIHPFPKPDQSSSLDNIHMPGSVSSLPQVCRKLAFNHTSELSDASKGNIGLKPSNLLQVVSPPSSLLRRVVVRPRITAGIFKQRTRRHPFCSNSSSAASSVAKSSTSAPSSAVTPNNAAGAPTAAGNISSDKVDTGRSGAATVSAASNPLGRLTWKDALKGPRKAAAFALQSARDLIDWGRHMWAGVKLLAADTRVSWKIVKKVTQGKSVTRRERNFMVQTGVDLARLVPFSLFLIVPLAEFALPFALRLFPNMLPSQFQSQMQKEENMKRQLKANIEIAKFLRDVVEEKAKNIKSSNKDSAIKKEAEELTEFLEAIRSGKSVDVSQVSRFARLFDDELTLDGAVRPQLVAMCKYMGISAHGTDNLLRYRLRSRLNSIKKDDMTITWEGGSDSLTDEEVERACRDRGIRTVDVTKADLRRQLSDWLDMSQDKAIPASLLIMSRAFLYSTGEDALKETLSSLPDDVYEDVKMDVSGGDASNADRLEEARRQSKLIEIESEREARKGKELAERKKRLEEEQTLAATAAAAASAPPTSERISDAESMAAVAAQERVMIKEHFEADKTQPPILPRLDDAIDTTAPGRSDQPTFDISAKSVGDVPATSSEVKPSGEESILVTKDEEALAEEREAMSRVVDALSELSSESAVVKERQELEELKNELAVAESVLKSLGGGNESELRRFRSTIAKLDSQIERIDKKLGGSMKVLDLDDDGVMSMKECEDAIKLLGDDETTTAISREALRRLDADKDGNISREDFDRVLKELQVEAGGLATGANDAIADDLPSSDDSAGNDGPKTSTRS